MTRSKISGQAHSTGSGQAHAGARSALYAALSGGFFVPDKGFFRSVASGRFKGRVAAAARGLPFRLKVPAGLGSPGTDDLDGLASDFIRIFEVSVGGPPCPLNEGHYGEDRQTVMEELLRFYEHFDLALDGKGRELPDHISVEIEFMHYLTFREARALRTRTDPGAYRRAQRDFLGRHLARWVPRLLVRLDKLGPPRFYLDLCHFLNEFITKDHKSIMTAVGRDAGEKGAQAQ